jgi:hypothetical protein
MAQRTFLAAGQRYAGLSATPWRVDEHLTVLEISHRRDGQALVTFRDADGDLETAPAAQFEAAIAGGVLVPIVGTGRIATC